MNGALTLVVSENMCFEIAANILGTDPDDKIGKAQSYMDGITFLKKLMRYYPLPVIIVSSRTSEVGKLANKAYVLGVKSNATNIK